MGGAEGAGCAADSAGETDGDGAASLVLAAAGGTTVGDDATAVVDTGSADGVAPEDLPDLDGKRPAPVFPTKLAIDESVDWTAFSVWLSALLHARGDDVMRVKGVVRTPAGRLLLQSVRKTVQSPEILPDVEGGVEREDNAVVVIGRGYRAEDLRRSLARSAVPYHLDADH